MRGTFTTMDEHKAKTLPRPDEGSHKVDLAGTVQRARLAEMKRRAEWDSAHKNEEPANPYESLSDEELMVLAGEELTPKQMKTLLKERQARGRRRKP